LIEAVEPKEKDPRDQKNAEEILTTTGFADRFYDHMSQIVPTARESGGRTSG